MEIALASLGDLLPDPATGVCQTEAARHRSLVDQAVMAERLGFDAIHLGKHHFTGYMLSSPPVVLAAIGERTSTLRLGTSDDENVRLLSRLLTETAVTWSGSSRPAITDLTTRPRPLGTPLKWIGAGSRESVELAAELGVGLMLPSVFGRPEMFRPLVDWYHEAWAAHGRAEVDARVGAITHTHVGPTTTEARARWRAYYENYWSFVGGLLEALPQLRRL